MMPWRLAERALELIEPCSIHGRATFDYLLPYHLNSPLTRRPLSLYDLKKNSYDILNR